MGQFPGQSNLQSTEASSSRPAMRSTRTRKRSKAGLDDERVAVCADRGNKYHKQKRAQLHIPSSSIKDQRLPSRSKELVKTIYKELREAALVSAMGDVLHTYLPCTQLRQILTPERISFIIPGLPHFNELSDSKTRKVVEGIWTGGNNLCEKPCVKLLAASIRADKGKSFFNLLIRRHATDECLPPIWDGISKVECRSCKYSHTLLDDEDLDSKAEFVRWAHAVNAAFFTTPTERGKQHAHYVLTKEDVLPIKESNSVQQESNHDTWTSGQGGAFSQVRKVQFHPDHYDLGSTVSTATVRIGSSAHSLTLIVGREQQVRILRSEATQFFASSRFQPGACIPSYVPSCKPQAHNSTPFLL